MANPADSIVQGNNEFALDLYRRLASAGSSNLFFSPYSISSALAMTFAGARGETEREMANVLGYPMGQQNFHSKFAGLNKAILAGEMSKLYDAVVRNDDKDYAVNTALYDLIMPYASRLGSLRDMTKELFAFHETLWKRENRPFHWSIIEAHYLQMLMEWDKEYNLIQYDLIQVGTSGKHLPREDAGFLFENL